MATSSFFTADFIHVLAALQANNLYWRKQNLTDNAVV